MSTTISAETKKALGEWLSSTKVDSSLLSKRVKAGVIEGNQNFILEQFLNHLSVHSILSAPFPIGEQVAPEKQETVAAPAPSVSSSDDVPSFRFDLTDSGLNPVEGGVVQQAPVKSSKVAFVDVMKIITGYVQFYEKTGPNLLTKDILLKETMTYFGKTIKESGLLNSTKTEQVLLDATFLEILNTLVQNSIHRLAVLTPEKNVVGVFSQTDLLLHLNEKLADWPDLGNLKIEDIQLISKDVLMVNSNVPTIDTIEKLAGHQVGAMVIVDDNKKFVDLLTGENFRGFKREQVFLLDKSVIHFKEFGEHRKAVTSNSDITVKDLLKLFIDNKTHQVVFIDSNHTVIGIVTTTDIVKLIHHLLH